MPEGQSLSLGAQGESFPDVRHVVYGEAAKELVEAAGKKGVALEGNFLVLTPNELQFLASPIEIEGEKNYAPGPTEVIKEPEPSGQDLKILKGAVWQLKENYLADHPKYLENFRLSHPDHKGAIPVPYPTESQKSLLARLLLAGGVVHGQSTLTYLGGHLRNHAHELVGIEGDRLRDKAMVLIISALAELANAAMGLESAKTVKGGAVLRGLPPSAIVATNRLVGSKAGVAGEALRNLKPLDFAVLQWLGVEEAENLWRVEAGEKRRHPLRYNREERKYFADESVVDPNHPLVVLAVENLNNSVLPDALIYRREEHPIALVNLPSEAWRPVEIEVNGGLVRLAKLKPIDRPYPFEWNPQTQTFEAIPRLVDPLNPAVVEALSKLNERIKGETGQEVFRIHQKAYQMNLNRYVFPRLLFPGVAEVKAWTEYEVGEFLRLVSRRAESNLTADVGADNPLSIKIEEEKAFAEVFFALDEKNLPLVAREGRTDFNRLVREATHSITDKEAWSEEERFKSPDKRRDAFVLDGTTNRLVPADYINPRNRQVRAALESLEGKLKYEPIFVLRFLGDIPEELLVGIYKEIIKRKLTNVVVQQLPYSQEMLFALAEAALKRIDLEKIKAKIQEEL